MKPAEASLRVCHIVEAGEAGTLAMVLLAAEAQRAKGHHVLVVYCRRPGTPAGLKTMPHPDIHLVELRMRPVIPYLPVWFLRCAREVRLWDPEILFLHSFYAGFFGRLLAGRRFGGAVLYFTHATPAIRTELSPFARAVARALERLAQTACPAVFVASSRSERAAIAREIGGPVRLLENAVHDRVRSFRRDRRPRPELLRVVSCARIAPQKNPELFAEICQIVRSARPEIEFEWLGDGDSAALRTLQKAGIRVSGFIPREEALSRVAQACVYLSTSTCESLPVSIMEAMLLGVPVVCPNADWSRDLSLDGETAFLYDDARSAAAILLSADAGSLASVSEAAYRMASERFSQDRYATELELMCREVQSGKPV